MLRRNVRILSLRIMIKVMQCSFSTECSCLFNSILISEEILEYSRTWFLVKREGCSVIVVSIVLKELREECT